MTSFDESKHPRDKDGKFTAKGGATEFRLNASYNEILKSTLDLPDETIPRSVGAKWVNEEIIMPDGSTSKFVEGSKVTHRQVFAGKGTKTPIRDIDRLVSDYSGSKAELWQKLKGHAMIKYNGEEIKAELHWYEEPSVGRVETKFKKEL